MTELANFPMVSQRDGDENQDFDCVPACIAAALQWLLKKPYKPGAIKDAVYGNGYTGGTEATNYIDYCAQQGVKLSWVNGSGMALISLLHHAIQSGKPCLITEPDPYLAGWSHVCVAYKEEPGKVTVLDPWIAQPVTKTDQEWSTLLEFNQIWPMEKQQNMLNLTDSWVRNFFSGDDSKWHCQKTGFDLIGGILGFYRRINGAPRLPLSGEKYDIPGVAYQIFESGIVVWDPQEKVDAPGGQFEPAYLLKLDSPLAKKILGGQPDLSELHAQLVTADSALQSASNAVSAALTKI